jgi:nitrogen regulatory protein P-II 1
MKKLEIIIRPEKLENLKVILNCCKVGGMTVMSVMGCGNQKGAADIDLKGLKVLSMNLIPKIQATVVVDDGDVEELLSLLHESISSGKVGDGKVFVSPVDDIMRMRTGERGKKAL